MYIDIYSPDEEFLYSVIVDSESYRRWQVMGENQVTLKFSFPGFVDIPIGAYVDFKGQRYSLYRPTDFQKDGTRRFGYTVKLESFQSLLENFLFINIPDNRLKFSRTARPHEFLEALVVNLNRRNSGWTVGACIEANPQTISFNHTTCADALRSMAETFNTEWEINNKEINLRKVEYFRDKPIALQYGKGNGFRPGIGRGNFDNNRPVERLYIQGGSRNIDYSQYGSLELLLPKDQVISYDGSFFEDQPGFNPDIARAYRVDDNGLSIIRKDKRLESYAENSLDLSDIYPMREGIVTAVEKVPGDEHDHYDFFDNTIPDNLDYSQYRINGEKMTVIFQSGMLAGREFDLEQTEVKVTGYIHVDPDNSTNNRRFQLVSQESDGMIMPSGNFVPAVGDKYAVFGMMMPNEYVRDDTTRSGASWELFREAVRYKYDNEDQRFSFKGELDPIFAKKNWENIGGHIIPGGYVDFSDTQFQPEGVLIRITAIKEYLHEPYKPTIELSNVTVSGGVYNDLNRIDQNEVVTDNRVKEVYNYTRRQWRDTQETAKMLEQLALNFSKSINPITVQTMQLIAGSESLQFRFVTSKTNPEEIDHLVSYNPQTKKLTTGTGILQHMTLGITAISGAHNVSEYKFWDMTAFTSGELLEADKSFYFYAKVPRSGTTGVFMMDAKPHDMNEDPAYYYLLMGILNSEYENDRSYSPLYGFTEVLPGRIVTNKIVSNDGKNYIDFLANAARIGNDSTYLDFNSRGDGVMRLMGTIVQNIRGDEDVLSVSRGAWVRYSSYCKGDIVQYKGSSYRAKANFMSYASPEEEIEMGVYDYWEIYAAKGEDGKDGEDGKEGKQGRIFTYRGEYKKVDENNSPVYYHGSDQFAQVVRANIGTVQEPIHQFFYTSADAGEFTGIEPGRTSGWEEKWLPYGASFESVATSLLFAEKALIAGFNFFNDRIESVAMDGDGKPNIVLDGLRGLAEITGRFVSNSAGSRIVIDPNLRSIRFYTPTADTVNGRDIMTMGFSEESPSMRMMSAYPLNDTSNFYLTNKYLSFSKGVMAGESTYVRPEGLHVLHGSTTAFRVGVSLSVTEGLKNEMTLNGLPNSVQGLDPGQIWVDSNGYLRRYSG